MKTNADPTRAQPMAQAVAENPNIELLGAKDAVIGPVTLDQLRRGMDAGKVSQSTRARWVGTTDWQSVAEIIVANPGTARATPETLGATGRDPVATEADGESSPVAPDNGDAARWALGNSPATTAPTVGNEQRDPSSRAQVVTPRAPGEPALPKRRWKRRLALVAVVILSLAAVSTWIGIRYVARLPQVPLPIVAQRLPSRTLMIHEARLRSDLDEVGTLPDAYAVSALASVACGGEDVVALLQRAQGQDLQWLKHAGVLDLEKNEEVRQGLTCGVTLQKAMVSPSVVDLHFQDADHKHRVSALRSSLTSLPTESGFLRHNFSGMDGHCFHPKDAKTDCPDGTPSSVHDGQTWFFGKLEAIEAFARAYTTAHAELSSTVEILQSTVSLTGGADDTRILAKPEEVPWRLPCERAAPIEHKKEFIDGCFPAGQDRLLDAVATKVRGLAVERNVLAKGDAYRLRYVLLARDEEAARDIEKDLLDLARDWRAQVANREPDLMKLLRAPSEHPHDKFWEAAAEPLFRALRGVEVSRSGAVVRVTLSEVLRPIEAKSLKELAATRSSEEAALVSIVDALLQGAKLPEKSLAAFVGSDIAGWMAAPRATVADCASVRNELTALTQGGVPPEMFGLKFEVEKHWADTRCVGAVFPPELKSCVDGAKDLTAFASCRLPPSPFVMAAARRLEGQWEGVVNQDGSGTSSRGSRRYQPAGAERLPLRLEFVRGRLALGLGDHSYEGDADLQSDDVGRASFVTEGKDGVVRHSVALVDDRTIVVVLHGTANAKGVEVTLKKATFERTLFKKGDGAGAERKESL
jgi:hypothetical protein